MHPEIFPFQYFHFTLHEKVSECNREMGCSKNIADKLRNSAGQTATDFLISNTSCFPDILDFHLTQMQ